VLQSRIPPRLIIVPEIGKTLLEYARWTNAVITIAYTNKNCSHTISMQD
jgi:hypothetical protein